MKSTSAVAVMIQAVSPPLITSSAIAGTGSMTATSASKPIRDKNDIWGFLPAQKFDIASPKRAIFCQFKLKLPGKRSKMGICLPIRLIAQILFKSCHFSEHSIEERSNCIHPGRSRSIRA